MKLGLEGLSLAAAAALSGQMLGQRPKTRSRRQRKRVAR